MVSSIKQEKRKIFHDLKRNVARVLYYGIISIYITKDYPREERILCTPLHRKKINEVAH